MLFTHKAFHAISEYLPFFESHQIMPQDFLLPKEMDSKTSDFSCKNTQHQFFVSKIRKLKYNLNLFLIHIKILTE